MQVSLESALWDGNMGADYGMETCGADYGMGTRGAWQVCGQLT